MRLPLRTAVQLAAAAACTAATLATPASGSDGHSRTTTQPWAAPPIEQSISVLDGRTGDVLTLDEMVGRLATADAVFLGETHNDETTHRVELAVYERLLRERDGRVVLAMEMFERDTQPTLDDYLDGAIDEAAFLADARAWVQYRTAYRPLIEHAKAGGHPVVASNIPRALARRLSMEGLGVLEDLSAAERAHAPSEFFPNTPAYWARVDNAIRGHVGMMRRDDPNDQRLTSTQTLWDNTMAESCALALESNPGAAVLHVNGAFHSQYWDGTVRQLTLRRPGTRVLTVDIRPTRNPGAASIDEEGEAIADFVVFAESRAADRTDGMWSVAFDRSLGYALHLPESHDSAGPLPLLFWFGDDGLTAQDGLDLWRDRLGDETAIVVVQPPYRAAYEDRSEGGRWFWTDSFAGDLGSLVASTQRIWAYLMRYHDLDPERVCVAGEGTGGTVAAAVALLGTRMDADAVAFEPTRYAKLKDFPLPLPPRGEAPSRTSSLRVTGSNDAETWWASELDAYTDIGLETLFESFDNTASGRDQRQERDLRAMLGLPAQPDAEGGDLATLRVPAETPRARHWARLFALRHADATGQPVTLIPAESDRPSTISLADAVSPETAGEVIPKCPGPFGGTTVLVLPEGTGDADAAGWLSIEENDPLNKQSRFHRVRIAIADEDAGERSLPRMLETLESQNRKNILIVPATFYAPPASMRALERQTRRFADRMTLRWMPGLGGEDLPTDSAAGPAEIGVIDHTLRVTLDPASHGLAVSASTLLPRAVRRAGTEFTLNSAFEITHSEPLLETIGTETTDSGLRITRYAFASPAESGSLELEFEGVIDFGLADENEQYSRGFRHTHGILGSEGVFLSGGSAWVPRFAGEMVRFGLTVESPAGWHVVSQGSGSSDSGNTDAGTTTAAWRSRSPVEQVYLVGGPLTVQRDSAGSVETIVYLHERDEALARRYLDATARYIEMYRKLIGPYPYDKFALVENFWETGYGMPSFTLLGEEVIRLPFILHSSYPHEILHNWWGNSVFVDDATGNWCEGLTAYMADHLIQEQRGTGTNYRRDTLQKYRSFVKDGRDFPLREFRSRHSASTEAVGYGKSLMVFHMLRRRAGDDAFRAAMADFYRKNKGERAGFDDIRASLESVTGEDLVGFFEQWVDLGGAPSLVLQDARTSGPLPGGGFTVAGTIVQRQSGEPFDLSVPVVIATESGQAEFGIDTISAATPFELRVDDAPVAIAVDPSFDLFRLLDPFETPSSIGQIFGEPEILAVLPRDGSTAAYRALVEGWATDAHTIEIVHDDEIELLPDDRGVWVLGTTNRFASELIGSDQSAGETPLDSVDLAGETVSTKGSSIVVIRRNPSNPEKAIGWISVDPPEAFPGFARKLPHYGKYSYLAFEGAEPSNTAKGQWETSDSPLVVELEPGGAAAIEPDTRPALAELPPVFSERVLREHVEWLADPEREGRGLGSAGLDASSAYIAAQFEAAGLAPAGDDGTWFQRFTADRGPSGTPVDAVNVVGVLPGSNDAWSDQSVVVGAHYDHLGRGWPDVHAGDEGEIHPGADDNASGVAVLIELARTMAAEGGGSRNLVFAAFSGEEAGRLGSRHYVAHPPFPVDQIRGMINMDAVGRLGDGEIAVHATGTADEWQHIFRGVGFVTGIRSRNIPARVGGSDEESFIGAGVPAVHLFTGAHADYHRPSDTADKIDHAGLVKVATFTKEALAYLIEREDPMAVRIAGHSEAANERSTPAAGARRVSVGTVPSFGFGGPGVKVDDVIPGSPAAAAGIRPGDVLVRIDQTELADLRAFSDALKQLEPDQRVTIGVLRDGERIEIELRVVAK